MEIKFSENNPKRLDLEYYEDLSKVTKFLLIVGTMTMISGLINLLTGYFSLAIVSVTAIFVWSIYVWYAITYHKPGAIFHARALLIFTIVDYLLEIALVLYAGVFLQLIWKIAWMSLAGYCLYMVFSSSDVDEAFPEDYRKASTFDIIFASTIIGLPFLIIGINIIRVLLKFM